MIYLLQHRHPMLPYHSLRSSSAISRMYPPWPPPRAPLAAYAAHPNGGATIGAGKAQGSEGPAPTTCTPPVARRLELPAVAAAQSSSDGRRRGNRGEVATGAAHPRRGGSAASRAAPRRSSPHSSQREVVPWRSSPHGGWRGSPLRGAAVGAAPPDAPTCTGDRGREI
jgi:hypothetical protein